MLLLPFKSHYQTQAKPGAALQTPLGGKGSIQIKGGLGKVGGQEGNGLQTGLSGLGCGFL